jgi:hypothetical protein
MMGSPGKMTGSRAKMAGVQSLLLRDHFILPHWRRRVGAWRGGHELPVDYCGFFH